MQYLGKPNTFVSMEYKGVCNSSPKTLLLKFTSRQRPDILLQTVSEYIRLASDTKNMCWLFSFDQDCVCASIGFSDKLQALLEPVSPGKAMVFTGISESKIHAVNRDVNEFTMPWDVLVCASDDQRPIIQGWDNIIRNAMPDHLDSSLWFHDGVQPRINTMEILGRAYYERFNYIYHPSYKSFFCDNESTIVAQKLGKQIKSAKCIIKHEHYAANGVVKFDALYERNNLAWKHDEDLFKARQQINFGL